MCRLAGYIGPDIALGELIFDPEHSLVAQSKEAHEAKMSVNGDGFGVAWYGDLPQPGLFKHAQPAWSDQNLLCLSRHIRAGLILAHVRAATTGGMEHGNCHPFAFDRFSFAHNGQIGGYITLRRQLENALPDCYYAVRQGNTDSEVLFLLLLANGFCDDPVRAISKTIRQVETLMQQAAIQEAFKFTFLCSNGAALIACRYSSNDKAPTLFSCPSLFAEAHVVASEPLNASENEWQEIPNATVLITHNNGQELIAL